MGSRQIPGRVDGLVAVPFHDERHEPEVEGAERGREQEAADVAVGDFDRAPRLNGGDRGKSKHDLLHSDLRAERRVAVARVDREHPVDGREADGKSVKDERDRCSKQAERTDRQHCADRRPADQGDETNGREGGDVEIISSHNPVRSMGRRSPKDRGS